jgi:hypothetical protein
MVANLAVFRMNILPPSSGRKSHASSKQDLICSLLALLFDLEGEGSMFIQNVSILL